MFDRIGHGKTVKICFIGGVVIILFLVFCFEKYIKKVKNVVVDNGPRTSLIDLLGSDKSASDTTEIPTTGDNFKCPEDYGSPQAYKNALVEYIKYYRKTHPNMTLEEFLTHRYYQLIDHLCIDTLKNIDRDISSTSTSSKDSLK